jgi:hypothetical protein
MMRIGERLSDRMMNRMHNYPYCAQHWNGVSDLMHIWRVRNRVVNRVLYRVRQRVLEHVLDSTRCAKSRF